MSGGRRVLLVEDNPGDVELVREALLSSHQGTSLSVVTNGIDALEFLHRRGQYAEAEMPSLILLDLNLPRTSGHEVLADIKSDVRLKRVPTIVLSSSAAHADVMSSYDLGANCFITKPVDLDQFLDVVQSLERFWLGIATLPPG